MDILSGFLCNIQSNPYLSTIHTQVCSSAWENKYNMVIFCSVPSQTQDNHMHKPPAGTQNMRVQPHISAISSWPHRGTLHIKSSRSVKSPFWKLHLWSIGLMADRSDLPLL